MAIGPYDNTSPMRKPQVRYVSQHVDLPFSQLQEFQRNRTKAYYQGLGAAEELEQNMANVHALTQDKTLRNQRIAEYESRIDQAVQEAGGDYSMIGGSLMNIGRGLGRELQSGQLGAIESNYQLAQQYKGELDELLKDGKISLNKYNQLSMMSNVGYTGVESDIRDSYSTYSGIKAAEDVDLVKYVDDHLKDWKKNVFASKQWGQSADGKYWKMTGGKKEWVDENELKTAALQAMGSDPKIKSFIDQEVAMAEFNAMQKGENFDESTFRKNLMEAPANFGSAKYGYDNTVEAYSDIKQDKFALEGYKKNLEEKVSGFSHEVSFVDVNPAYESYKDFTGLKNGGAMENVNTAYTGSYQSMTGIENPLEARKAVIDFYSDRFKTENKDFNPNSPEGREMVNNAWKTDLYNGNVPTALMNPDLQMSAEQQRSMYNAITETENTSNMIAEMDDAATSKATKNSGYNPDIESQKQYQMESLRLDPSGVYTLPSMDRDSYGKDKTGESFNVTGKELGDITAVMKHLDEHDQMDVGKFRVMRIDSHFNTPEGTRDFDITRPVTSLENVVVDAVKGLSNSKPMFSVIDKSTGKKYYLSNQTGIEAVDKTINTYRSPSASKKSYDNTYKTHVETRERPKQKQWATSDFGTYIFPDGSRVSSAQYAKSLDTFVKSHAPGLNFYTSNIKDGEQSLDAVKNQIFEDEEIQAGKAELKWSPMGIVLDGATNGMSGDFMATWTISKKDGSNPKQIFLPLSKIGGGVYNGAREDRTLRYALALNRAVQAGGEGQTIYHPDTNQPIARVLKNNQIQIGNKAYSMQAAVPQLVSQFR